MKELSNRTARFTDSVIRRMTRISNKYGAVNLSQGFPDFDPPAQLLNSLSTIAADPKPLYHQYSITWGAQNFREALAAKQTRYMGRTIDPNSEIVVTCGSTEAMMTAMMTVTNPGDKVVIFSPFYENYGADTILTGAEPIYVPLTPPEFTFDPEVLENAFRQHPKALILCNPSNPCGKVFTRDELELIAGHAKKYDVYVITDEEYELLCSIERLAPQVFAEEKHGPKKVCANVDLFSGLIYNMLGISEDLYTPLFAIARVPGWCAHRVEEVIFANRIIRPAYKYLGVRQKYKPIEER